MEAKLQARYPDATAAGLIGTVSALTSWWFSRDWHWLTGGMLLFLVIPFTLAAILPINKRLKRRDLDLREVEAGLLLQRWGRLHAVRSILGVVAFIWLVLALVGSH